MTKANIEQTVRGLFQQYFYANIDAYPLTGKGTMTHEGAENAKDWALTLYSSRNETQIFRDEELDITSIDYVEWVMAELAELNPIPLKSISVVIAYCRSNDGNLTEEQAVACARICIADDNGHSANPKDIALIRSLI